MVHGEGSSRERREERQWLQGGRCWQQGRQQGCHVTGEDRWASTRARSGWGQNEASQEEEVQRQQHSSDCEAKVDPPEASWEEVVQQGKMPGRISACRECGPVPPYTRVTSKSPPRLFWHARELTAPRAAAGGGPGGASGAGGRRQRQETVDSWRAGGTSASDDQGAKRCGAVLLRRRNPCTPAHQSTCASSASSGGCRWKRLATACTADQKGPRSLSGRLQSWRNATRWEACNQSSGAERSGGGAEGRASERAMRSARAVEPACVHLRHACVLQLAALSPARIECSAPSRPAVDPGQQVPPCRPSNCVRAQMRRCLGCCRHCCGVARVCILSQKRRRSLSPLTPRQTQRAAACQRPGPTQHPAPACSGCRGQAG